MFSDHVCENLRIYIYRLIDPRNGETFYVGKGRENRVFEHIRENIPDDETDRLSAKLDRIRAIKAAGLEVQHIIHRHGIDSDPTAFEVEAAVIDAYPGLSNVQGGHGSADFGPMNAVQIKALYELAKLPEDTTAERLILINVNRSIEEDGRDDYYSRVRFAWRISKSEAEKAHYVCAVVRGVIRGVYVADQWLLATKENFPEFAHVIDAANPVGRYGFVGRDAPPHVWDRLVNKRLPEKYRHVRYPIRYYP